MVTKKKSPFRWRFVGVSKQTPNVLPFSKINDKEEKKLEKSKRTGPVYCSLEVSLVGILKTKRISRSNMRTFLSKIT